MKRFKPDFPIPLLLQLLSAAAKSAKIKLLIINYAGFVQKRKYLIKRNYQSLRYMYCIYTNTTRQRVKRGASDMSLQLKGVW